MQIKNEVPSGSQGGLGETREGLFERLKKLLSMHRQLLKGLLVLAKNKEKALVKSDIPEIQKITEAENTLILQSGQVESQRQQVTENLTKQLVANECQTISELLPYLPQDWSQELSGHIESLRDLIQELKEQNERNSTLIHHSLDFLQQFYEILGRASEVPGPAYDPRRTSDKESRSFFNKRV